jgi:MerR family transcriptional regulator, copper efflux regulator
LELFVVKSLPKFLTTASVGKNANVGRETLRFYEEKGLIKPVGRTAAGYRQFASDIVERIAFIKQTQRAGFTLKEIHELLKLRATSQDSCGAIAPVLAQKLDQVNSDIAALQEKRAVLAELAGTCAQQDATRPCQFVRKGPGCC